MSDPAHELLIFNEAALNRLIKGERDMQKDIEHIRWQIGNLSHHSEAHETQIEKLQRDLKQARELINLLTGLIPYTDPRGTNG